MDVNRSRPSASTVIKSIGLWLGPIAFLVPLVFPVLPTLEGPGRAAAATTAWMAIWWITEAIPIPATALLPIVLFPLTGVLSAGEVTLQYGNSLIFLFLGGFLLSGAIQKWGLHKRIALRIILTVGLSPSRIVLGFMVATGFLSMWISNTATALMMVPIGLAVIHQVEAMMGSGQAGANRKGSNRTGSSRTNRHDPADNENEPAGAGGKISNFGVALMLSIAYGASIGGLGTLIGSPPNAIFAGFAETALGESISFVQWMYFGVPLAVVGLALAWLYLTRIAFPVRWEGFDGAADVMRREYQNLGSMTTAEKRVATIFALMAGLWIFRGLLENVLVEAGLGAVTDTTVAIAGALLLFITSPGAGVNGAKQTAANNPEAIGAESDPGSAALGAKSSGGVPQWRGLLEWEDAQSVPWGILLLFGGGLTLAKGIESSGTARWLAEQLAVLQGTAPWLIVLAVTTLVLLLTEVSSNTATATVFMPVMVGLAGALGVQPQLLMVAAATAASSAFMLPVATPPNAIVFGSGYVTSSHMFRAGFWLNLVFILLLAAFAYGWLPIVWGLERLPVM